MTWVAACSGQRGIYQELIMTDEERQKLIADLRHPTNWMDDFCKQAADEIERLDKLLNTYRRAFGYIDRTREEKGELP
jgi:hypothetical protein